MSEHFRVEPAEGRLTTLVKFIKVYPKSNDCLPQKIDVEKRFSVVFSDVERVLDCIHNLKIRDDDVWVVTVPKAGTTWMLELAWLLKNDLDYKTALGVEQEERCPFLEFCTLFSILPDSIKKVEELKSPRVIKTHLPMHLLPKELWTVKPKIIYVARDPKDVVVSQFYYADALGTLCTSKDQYINNFLADFSFYLPFWSHVVEFWKLRNESYVYFTSFERMKKDLQKEVCRISEFLEKPINGRELEKLVAHLSFEQMKNNPSCNHLSENEVLRKIHNGRESSFRFVRKGVVGGYTDDLSNEFISRFDEWTKAALEAHGVTLEEILYL